MSKVKISSPPAIPEPVDQGPVGSAVRAGIDSRRAENETYLAESDRLAAYEAIARLAIVRRGQLGLTQAQVARRMGTTASAVSRIESGRHSTTARTLKRLCEALESRLLIGMEFEDSGEARREWVAAGPTAGLPIDR